MQAFAASHDSIEPRTTTLSFQPFLSPGNHNSSVFLGGAKLRSLLFVGAILLTGLGYAALPGSGSLANFGSADAAQAHCPDDAVVWLNLYSGIYHFAGSTYYANTSNGTYVCKRDADKAGDRASRNGS